MRLFLFVAPHHFVFARCAEKQNYAEKRRHHEERFEKVFHTATFCTGSIPRSKRPISDCSHDRL